MRVDPVRGVGVVVPATELALGVQDVAVQPDVGVRRSGRCAFLRLGEQARRHVSVSPRRASATSARPCAAMPSQHGSASLARPGERLVAAARPHRRSVAAGRARSLAAHQRLRPRQVGEPVLALDQPVGLVQLRRGGVQVAAQQAEPTQEGQRPAPLAASRRGRAARGRAAARRYRRLRHGGLNEEVAVHSAEVGGRLRQRSWASAGRAGPRLVSHSSARSYLARKKST